MPWGDYGDILLAGMTSHLPRQSGLLQLERTGPFMPPISFPGIGDIIVTQSLRRLLEESGLSGFHFSSIVKTRIVRLNWRDWDVEADDPLEYPGTGEPEDYVLERPHIPEISDEIGDLWELRFEECAETDREVIDPHLPSIRISLIGSTWQHRDCFRAKNLLYNYVTEKAKNWLDGTVGEWVSFEHVHVK